MVVEIEAPRAPVLSGGSRTFDTDRGIRVTLTRGFLNLGSVEIFGCATGDGASHWLAPVRLREAHAHVEGSPTLLGSPAVESLLAEDGSRMKVGDLHPPPGSYCRVKQTILAADADAPGLPSDGSMLGRSLLVEGSYALAGRALKEFRFTSTASFDVETAIDPTTLTVDGRRVVDLVLVKTSDRWFDGVDLDADELAATTRILQNLRLSLGARVE